MDQLNAAIDAMIEAGVSAAEVIGYLELLKHDLVQQVLDAEEGED